MSKKKQSLLTLLQKDNKKLSPKAVLSLVLDVFMWFIGSVMFSAGVVLFIRPYEFTSGGVTGIALIINHIFPSLPIGALAFAINIPLFVAAWRTLGMKFIINTFVATGMVSASTDIIVNLVEKYNWEFAGNDKLIGAIFGGVLTGVGLGIVFLHGATTGGTDILARLLKLKFAHIPVGKIVLFLDLAVILANGIVFRNVESILYSLVISFLSGQAIDYVVAGRSHSKMLLIITKEPDNVTDDIMNICGRGVSIIHADGGYTKEEKKMLMCVVRAHEVSHIRKIIAKYDENPFIVVTDSSEVLGLGFKSHMDTL